MAAPDFEQNRLIIRSRGSLLSP